MLNKNQSNKRNSWKYGVVLPLLGAFVFFFQVNVIAQERNSELTVVEQSKPVENSVDVYKISKNTTDAELKENSKFLKEKYDISLDFSNVERNSKNELTSIKVKLKKGKEITKEMATTGTEAIKTFGIIISKNANGLLTVDFGTGDTVMIQKSTLTSPNAHSVLAAKKIFIDGVKVGPTEIDKLDQNIIDKVDVNTFENTVRITTKTLAHVDNKNNVQTILRQDSNNQPLIVVDGIQQEFNFKVNDLPSEQIKEVNVLKGKLAEEKYGEKGKNGVVEIVTKIEKTFRVTTKSQSLDNLNIPIPPTPPTPPAFTFKTPKSPVFPKAPKAPKGNQINGDKKDWKDYENKMEDFHKKMEAMEPQMKAFEKQMEDFEKQMEPFNAEMEAFEKKMKIYELQMEKYDAKMKAEIKK